MEREQAGYSLVELMTVIIVIGILSSIAIVSTTGIMAQRRDSERSLAIETIANKLELYYKQNTSSAGKTYPTTTVMSGNLDNIFEDKTVLTAPGGASNSLIVADNTGQPTSITTAQYVYQPFDTSDRLCVNNSPCVRFTLYYRRETDNEIVKVESLHQQ